MFAQAMLATPAFGAAALAIALFVSSHFSLAKTLRAEGGRWICLLFTGSLLSLGKYEWLLARGAH